MKEYTKGDIIYLKFLRFADNKVIDSRLNGRPYLLYKIEDEKYYLFKLGSNATNPLYYFTKVDVLNKGKKAVRSSYVDMRYYIVADKDYIENRVSLMFDTESEYRFKPKHGSKISEKDFKEVSNQVKILEQLDAIKVSKINYNGEIVM